jgi:hypothetical protein
MSSAPRDTTFSRNLLSIDLQFRRVSFSRDEGSSWDDHPPKSCVLTGATINLEAAHIIPFDRFGEVSPDARRANRLTSACCLRNGILLAHAAHTSWDEPKSRTLRLKPVSSMSSPGVVVVRVHVTLPSGRVTQKQRTRFDALLPFDQMLIKFQGSLMPSFWAFNWKWDNFGEASEATVNATPKKNVRAVRRWELLNLVHWVFILQELPESISSNFILHNQGTDRCTTQFPAIKRNTSQHHDVRHHFGTDIQKNTIQI